MSSGRPGPITTWARLSLRAAGLGAVLMLAAPAAVGAAPTWITPGVDVSANTATNWSNPAVAMNAAGDTIILFEAGSTVKSVYRPAGGSYGAPETVTTNMSPAIRKGVAIDNAGNAFATWTEPGGSSSSVKAAVRPPLGPWGASSTLESTNNPDESNIAVTPTGDAVAVWRLNGGAGGLRMARRPAAGSFGAPFGVFTSGTVAEQPQIDVNAGGDTVLGFRRRIGGGNFFALAAFEPAGSSAPSPAVFDPGAGSQDDDPVPNVGVDNSGNASVLLARGVTASTKAIKVSNKPAGSNAWSAITGTGGDVDTTTTVANPRMVWNDSGQEAATWNRGTTGTVEATTRTGLGSFASASEIGAASGGVNYTPAELAIDSNGNALTVFGRNGVLKSFRTSGVTWNAVNDIASSGSPFNIRVAADSAGDGVTAYIATNASATTSAFAAGFDGAGPVLNSIVFPSTATAGTAFPFSVTPTDVWSTVALTGWTFGDGGSASAASGNHTYGTGGSFTGTVTSTDSRGNSTSAVRNITVAGPRGGGGDGGTTPPDTTAPTVGGYSLAASAFRAASSGGSVAKKRAPVGTRVSYTLSEASTVKLTVVRLLGGRKRGGKCERPSRRNRKGKSCKRTVTVGTFTGPGNAGANSFKFTGRVKRRKLAPGSYQLLVQASDAAGNKSTQLKRSFRIVT